MNKTRLMLLVATIGFAPLTSVLAAQSDPIDAIKAFYQGYVKTGGTLTPELRKQLMSGTAENYALWEKCNNGVTSACSTDCTKTSCQYDNITIEKGLDYFTRTKKVDPKWATQIQPTVTYVDDVNGYILADVALPDAPVLTVSSWYEEGRWKLFLVGRKSDKDDV